MSRIIRLPEAEARTYLVKYIGEQGYECGAQWRFMDLKRWITVFPDFNFAAQRFDRDAKDELTPQGYDAILKHFNLYGIRNKFSLPGIRITPPRNLMVYRRELESVCNYPPHQAYSCEPYERVSAMFVA